jgi:PAS domain S-box-containing protein
MEVLLRELTDQRKVEYIVLDIDLKIQEMSAGAALFAETPAAVLVGADIRYAFPELAGIENELAAIAANGEGEWNVRSLSRSNSPAFPFSIDLTVRPHIPTGLVLIVEDVTARTRVEQRLLQHSNETRLLLQSVAAARDFLERVINALDDALFVTSPSGIVRAANTAASKLFGYHEGELIGLPITTFIRDQRLPRFDLSIQNVELNSKNKHGDELPLLLSTVVLRGEEQIPEHIVFIARDLRRQKAAEKQITKLRSENTYLLEEIEAAQSFHGLVGQSRAMKELFRQIEQVAQTDSIVLLLGETGTGKELVARAIHNLSKRRDHMLVKVNCAALQTSVIESELFGHEKGAFTGALSSRAGRFEFADGGTILLDEIGELPPETQAKLLRVLQEQEFERVGGNTTIKVNVRVIAATNRELEAAVKSGKFRSDLFFRINIFPIRMPTLRERREDIPLLAKHFLTIFSSRSNKQIGQIHSHAMQALLNYDWPGNVRELAAILERAVILTGGNVLEGSSLSFSLTLPREKEMSTASTLMDVEREYIVSVLKSTNGTIEGNNGAAIRLGLNPSTLRSKMKKLGIAQVHKSKTRYSE